jgi:hypothetical protein
MTVTDPKLMSGLELDAEISAARGLERMDHAYFNDPDAWNLLCWLSQQSWCQGVELDRNAAFVTVGEDGLSLDRMFASCYRSGDGDPSGQRRAALVRATVKALRVVKETS